MRSAPIPLLNMRTEKHREALDGAVGCLYGGGMATKPKPARRYPVRIPAKYVRRLERAAKAASRTPNDLMRVWALERLDAITRGVSDEG